VICEAQRGLSTNTGKSGKLRRQRVDSRHARTEA
jgi:hypothetical protein